MLHWKHTFLWPPDSKSWLTGKDPDGLKGWGREKGRLRMRWWMASPTRWTCVWASSRRWWRTGKPGVLQSVGSHRVEDWGTAQAPSLNNADQKPRQRYWAFFPRMTPRRAWEDGGSPACGSGSQLQSIGCSTWTLRPPALTHLPVSTAPLPLS